MNKNIKPYIVGSGIGLLITFVIVVLNKNLGNSNALVSFAGFIKSLFVSHKSFALSPYYKTYMIDRPIFEMQFATIIGLMLGAFVSAKTSKNKSNSFGPNEFGPNEFVPSVWKNSFGTSKKTRAFGALIGGTLVGFGARIADGCMSGLGLSSGIKLATSAWLFMGAVFVAAIITAHLVYKKGK